MLESVRPLIPELQGIHLIDNSASPALKALPSTFEKLEYVSFPQNRGFAAGANAGISRASSSLVLLLNPDVIVDPNVVRELCERMKQAPDTAIACPLLRNPDGTSQVKFQLRPLPTLASVISDALFLDELKALVGSSEAEGGEFNRDPEGIEVEQPAAAFWLLRKSVWEALKGFDVRFFPAWFEDVDYCKRAREGGWKLRLFPDLSAVHSGGCSLDSLGFSRFLTLHYGNLLVYWRKHHHRSLWLVWPAVQAGLLLRKVRGSL